MDQESKAKVMIRVMDDSIFGLGLRHHFQGIIRNTENMSKL